MDVLKKIAEMIAAALEVSAALLIAYAALEAMIGSVRAIIDRRTKTGIRKDIWIRFGVWLLLGLEFELAADIVRTAIAPSWTDIGQLASIGVIRTFLNYFLEKDLDTYEPRTVNTGKAIASQPAT